MKRLTFCLVVVVLGACTGAVVDDEPEPLDLSMAKAVAIEYALGASDLGTKDLVAPSTVEFIEDRDSVIEPFGEGMMVAPIKNDAGLLTIGVLIESEGKVYIAVDAHGQGWLFELTPTDAGGGAWDVQPIAEYIV